MTTAEEEGSAYGGNAETIRHLFLWLYLSPPGVPARVVYATEREVMEKNLQTLRVSRGCGVTV